MFLLGRGRAVTLRLKNPPRVRWVSQSLVCRGNDATAWKKPKDAQEKRRGIAVERDAQGRPIVKPREKSLGAFKPLPVDRLTHELFEPESEGPGRVELDFPPLQPRLLSPGVVTSFHHTDPTSPLRVFGVPKKMLVEFRILGVPCSVTTSTTLSIVRALQESISVPSRLILNGRAGCGKSFLLLQAVEYAAATEEWFVFYVPRAQRFVDGSTPYAYSLRTRTYLQLRAARETLRRLGTANEHILEHLYTTEPITLESGEVLPEGTPLLDVVDAGQDEEGEPNAHVCLEALMAEMGRQTVFPVLIAIDDFQALAGRSLYRDPHGHFIRPHHLGIPRLLLEYASGRKKLARGCVLGALSRTDTQFPVTPQLSASLNLPLDFAPSPRMAGVGRYGASGRWSSQLAQYLDHEIEVEEPVLDEYDEYDETEGVAANDQSESIEEESEEAGEAVEQAAEELADEAAEESTSEFESESDFDDEPVLDADADLENPWTGWRVYDPPIYEDTYQPTPAVPEPKPRSADEWKERVMRDEEDAELVSAALEDAEVDGESEVVAKDEKKTVRALRAIRVPDALSIREAAALFEVWLDTGLLRTGGERRAMRRAEIETMEEYQDLQAEVNKEIPYMPDPFAGDPDFADLFPAVAEETPKATPIIPAASSWKTEPQATATTSATATESQEVGPTTSWRESLKESTPAPVSEPSADDETPLPKDEFLTRRRKTALELEGPELDQVKALEEVLETQSWLDKIDAADKSALSLDQEIGRGVLEEEEGFGEELSAEEELLAEDEETLLAEDEEALLAEEEEALLAEEQEEVLAEDEMLTEEELLAAEEEESLAEEEELFEEEDETALDEELESESDVDEFISEALGQGDVDHSLAGDPEIAGILSDGVRQALLDPESVSDLARQPTDEEARVQEETGADDLFLGKYAESQGNARAFVWGGLIATLQTSG